MNHADESRKIAQKPVRFLLHERVSFQRLEKNENLPFAEVFAAADVFVQSEGAAFLRIKHELTTRCIASIRLLTTIKAEQSAVLLG